MVKWKMGWDTRIIRSTNFDCHLKYGEWTGSANLASCGGARSFLLLSNATSGFFNVRGTWQLSQHGASLWFAVKCSVLWPDDPSIQHAKGYPIPPPGANKPVSLWAERPSSRPGFWALFSRFYDKLSVAVGLFFWYQDLHGLVFICLTVWADSISLNIYLYNKSQVLSLLSTW